MRYRHYLQSPKQSRWPARIICVDVTGQWLDDVDDASCQTERLVSWHIAGLSLQDQRYVCTDKGTGQNPDQFWKILATKLIDTKYTWIISSNCHRVWALLGLWELIENGAVHCIGIDPREAEPHRSALRNLRQSGTDPVGAVSASHMQQARRRNRGYIVLQNPPNILRMRMPPSACAAQWVDVRNYGVAKPIDTQDGHDVTDWLAEFMDGYYRIGRICKLGSLQATIGSQSFHAWKHSYSPGGIYVHTHQQATALEKAGYFGGRTQCFYVGSVGDISYHLDIRSSYASCMADSAFPVRLRQYTRDTAEAQKLVGHHPERCIARVVLQTGEANYPYRQARVGGPDDADHNPTHQGDLRFADTDISFPIGLFETVLCGPELVDALMECTVTEVKEAAYYDCENCLSEYARTFYKLRDTCEYSGTHGLAALAKGLLVSLCGKFGQSDRFWVDSPESTPVEPYGEWYALDVDNNLCRYRAIGWKVQREIVRGYTSDAVPAIAGFITSYGRIKLLNLIRTARWENVLYVDTDSLIVNSAGYYLLEKADAIRNKELGKLYLKSQPSQLLLLAPKCYIEDGRIVYAGEQKATTYDCFGSPAYWQYSTPLDCVRAECRPEYSRILCTATLTNQAEKQ